MVKSVVTNGGPSLSSPDWDTQRQTGKLSQTMCHRHNNMKSWYAGIVVDLTYSSSLADFKLTYEKCRNSYSTASIFPHFLC